MKPEVFFGIAIRIVLVFAVAMAFTFVPEHLREFFGDKSCAGQTFEYFGTVEQGCPYGAFGVDNEWEWGARHYWYAWMVALLFVLSCVNLVISIFKLVSKHYEIDL